MKAEQLGAKIVVIGGGTGSFTLLSGLKNYASNITALVNMADDGGSTGVLRDELGVLPPGDVRQCLVALSDSKKVRDLFNYRFDDGALKGHAFGNLFLTALEKMTGNFSSGVELASEILNVTGKVEPVTLTNVTLCMEIKKGQVIRGEHEITASKISRRPKLWLEPKAKLNPAAKKAIEEADLVVIAPGNLYSSLAPALIVPGMCEALGKSTAKKVYICNLVTKPGQTGGYMVGDFASEIERFVGCEFLDYVLYNITPPTGLLLKRYTKSRELPVKYDRRKLAKKRYKAKGLDLIATKPWEGAQGSDPIAAERSFIRHDGDKVARQLMKIYFS